MNKKIDVGGFNLIPESQFGRITLLIMAGGGFYGLVALWPYHVIIGILILSLGFGYTSVRIYMLFSMHRLEIEEKRMEMMPPPPPKSEKEPVYDLEEEESEEEEPEQRLLAAPRTQTFHDLVLKHDLMKPNSDFVLAFDKDGGPIRMPRLTSLGIGGFPGSGKTVFTMVLLLETIIRYDGQVKFLIVDPHMDVAGDESLVSKVAPLSDFFLTVQDIRATLLPEDRDYAALLNRMSLPNPVSGGEELRNWMKVIELEMGRRLHGKSGETWVVVIDEYAAIMGDQNTARPVARMLEAMNNQARKMGMFSLLISQNWKASRTGGSELRDSIASFAVLQMPESVARLIVPDDIARQADRLERGEMILYSNGKAEMGRVPLATPEDAELIAHLYKPVTFVHSIKEEIDAEDFIEIEGEITQKLIAQPASLAPELPDEFMSGEMKDIQKLYASGLSEKSIAMKVYGVKSSGPELEEAMIQVRERLKWMVEHAGWR